MTLLKRTMLSNGGPNVLAAIVFVSFALVGGLFVAATHADGSGERHGTCPPEGPLGIDEGETGPSDGGESAKDESDDGGSEGSEPRHDPCDPKPEPVCECPPGDGAGPLSHGSSDSRAANNSACTDGSTPTPPTTPPIETPIETPTETPTTTPTETPTMTPTETPTEPPTETPPPSTPYLSINCGLSSAEKGDTFTITVTAGGLRPLTPVISGGSYAIELSLVGLGFTSCDSTNRSISIPRSNTSYTATLTVIVCETGNGRVSASLYEYLDKQATLLGSDTCSVTVRPTEPPTTTPPLVPEPTPIPPTPIPPTPIPPTPIPPTPIPPTPIPPTPIPPTPIPPTPIPPTPIPPTPIPPTPIPPTPIPPTPIPPTPTPEECTCPDDSAGPLSHDSSGKSTSRASSDESDTFTSAIVICIVLPEPAEDDEDNDASTVIEGKPAVYQLLSSRAPAADLTVLMRVTTTGGPFTDETGNREVEWLAEWNITELNFKIRTQADLVDEHNGAIKVTLVPDDAYVVHSTLNMASVTVADDDKPPILTGLRVNGHRDANGNITLRWDDHEGFGDDTTLPRVRFDVLYKMESCETDGGCSPDAGLTTVINIGKRETDVPNTREGYFALEDTEAKKLIRIRIRAKIVETSEDWSDFVIVFPTDAPLTRTRTVVENHKSYQVSDVGKNVVESWQHNGKFAYSICVPAQSQEDYEAPRALPDGFSVDGAGTTTSITSIVSGWDSAVVWQRVGGYNIIETTSNGSTTTCTNVEERQTFNQVGFHGDTFTNEICGGRTFACWEQTGTLEEPAAFGAIMIRGNPPRDYFLNLIPFSPSWSDIISAGCTRLHSTLRHETGHAFGFWHSDFLQSIMKSPPNTRPNDVCGPTKWDVAATMAIYQSRDRGPVNPT